MSSHVTFEKGIVGPLTRIKDEYCGSLKEPQQIQDVVRPRFLHAIGNTAILAFHENQELFDRFIEWLKTTRKEIQKLLESENET